MGEDPADYLTAEDEDTLDIAHPMDEAQSSHGVAEYLADMIGQLESLSRVAGLDLLTYLLSMARVEAETLAHLPVNESRSLRRL